jgi:hypothetical protein
MRIQIMVCQPKALPHWTWSDLELALDAFALPESDTFLREHLVRGLREDSELLCPQELLRQVLSAGWVIAQIGNQSHGSGIGHLHQAGDPAC